jgi:hypothetical protein
MSKIYELFGYRLDTWNDTSEHNLAKAWCPFMNSVCDGGGNRYLSSIDLRNKPLLQAHIPNKLTYRSKSVWSQGQDPALVGGLVTRCKKHK